MSKSRGMTAFILSLSFITLTIAACDTQSDRHNGGTAHSPAATMSPSPSPIVSPTISPSISPVGTLTPFDKGFMMDAARGGLMEVQLGNVAAHSATSNEVKRFGQRMAADHSQASQLLRQLASTLNITLPQELDPEQRNVVSRMQNLPGKDFDREYMKTMVNDHMKDVAGYERAASQATNPEVKQFASQTLPTLRDHLKMARDIAVKLGVKLPQSQ